MTNIADTASSPLTIAIAGAGLGGLALAHGLARAGHDVTVYEGDASRDARTQGYRISLDAGGRAALAEILPRERYEAILALETRNVGRGFTFAAGDSLRALYAFARAGD